MREALLKELNDFLLEHAKAQEESMRIAAHAYPTVVVSDDEDDSYFDDILGLLSTRDGTDEKSSQFNAHEQEIEAFLLQNQTCKFNTYLFQVIDQKKMTDSEVYHRAGIDRRVVSKIRSIQNYRPTKNTVIAFALGLQLSEKETEELLSSAGYAFAFGEVSDLIVLFCIRHEIYRIDEVDEMLFHFGQKLLCEK